MTGRLGRFLTCLSSGIARKGWLTKEDVVNTLPFEKLVKELKKKRARTAG